MCDHITKPRKRTKKQQEHLSLQKAWTRAQPFLNTLPLATAAAPARSVHLLANIWTLSRLPQNILQIEPVSAFTKRQRLLFQLR